MYRISEVSKITGIPIDSIRYYVQQGLISPRKKGAYSYYDVWCVNYLLDYKKYHNMGMSLKNIKEIFEQDDKGKIISRMEEHQRKYEFYARYYQYLAEKNREVLQLLEKIDDTIGCFEDGYIPEFYCLPHRHNYNYASNENEDAQLNIFRQSMEFMEAIVVFGKENLLSERPENDYSWYFGIHKKYSDLFLEDNHNLIQTERQKALYTTLTVGERGTFQVGVVLDVLRSVKEAGYTLNGNVVGQLLVKSHERGEFKRFIALWIPIK